MLYVVSADYDDSLNCIVLKLYNSETEALEYHYDNTFFHYFFSEHKITQLEGIIKQEVVDRIDALHDEKIKVWQVSVNHPDVVKNMNYQISGDKKRGNPSRFSVWENYIKIIQSYIYDNNIKIGMPYVREKGVLLLNIDHDAEKRVEEISKLANPAEHNKILCAELARLLEYPAPNFKRTSLDIEVLNEGSKVPSPDSANLPIICICMVTNTGKKYAFVLIQEDKDFSSYAEADVVNFYASEQELLEAVFNFAKDYPFILTFNGDEFDLPYMANRAIRLGIPITHIPISINDRMAYWKDAIHIDLYKFFFIRSMQVYAFQQKYKNVTLDEVSKALLKEGKHVGKHEWVGDMSYEELLTYCLKDAELTLRLTTYSDNLVMNLIIVLARLSYMPIERVSRKPISQWIRSMIYYEHRKYDILIPRSEDIIAMKGKTATTALVKGKKYKGAIVVEPTAGFHFNTKVGDFASLYPSIMKNHNLGYSTVNCPHEECKNNRVEGMPHWVCTKRKAIESQLIGTLKDLRVVWYKKRGKDKTEPRKAWYSVSEQSIKVICNASYGVFGNEEFVLYCPPFPECVTGIGRLTITQTIEHAQQLGLNVIYGDTDSIFIKNPDKDKLDELMRWASEKFDIDFELDKHYRYVCLSDRKKNYLGVLEDGTVDVKGLTGKKKHTPKIFKDTFETTKKLLSEIQKPEDVQIKRMAILKLVKTAYTTLKLRRWTNMNDLAFHVTASKSFEEYETEPQHVKAAKILQAQGYDVGQGSEISYVKTKDKGHVKPTALAKTDDIDVSKYIEFLQNTFIQILEPLGIDWDEDILGICQMDRFCVKQEQKT
jgi:DNA polymerase I